MLQAILQKLRGDRTAGLRHDALLLTSRQFDRELAKERIRASRRSIPFCVITIELRQSGVDRKKRHQAVVRLIHRNLRMTDQKALLSPGKFGVLLVDTPEMGGRACCDRLTGLLDRGGLNAQLHLRVHDPEGFDPDQTPSSGDRRRDDESSIAWSRLRGNPVAVSDEPTLMMRQRDRFNAKRLIDLIGGSVGLIATSPLWVPALLAIRLTSRGPVLFKQTREGLNGRPFVIYKMRTMVVNAEAQQAELRDQNLRDGPAFKITHDPRVTRVGQILRSTCIDELPQLINVLKGDMSLVGPRPLPWHESRACNRWQRRRLDVKPGMTCYWQVNKAAAETFDDWMRMDLRYVDQGGLVGDLKLIAQTIIVPVLGRGSQ